MGLRVDRGMIEHLAASTGACGVELRDATDPDAAYQAMERARIALFSIPHPEEPEDPFASFVSGVAVGPAGPTFWFDVADAEVHPGVVERVVAVLVEAIGDDVDGLLLVVEPARQVSTCPPVAVERFELPDDFPLPPHEVIAEWAAGPDSGHMSFWTAGPKQSAIDGFAASLAEAGYVVVALEHGEAMDKPPVRWRFTVMSIRGDGCDGDVAMSAPSLVGPLPSATATEQWASVQTRVRVDLRLERTMSSTTDPARDER